MAFVQAPSTNPRKRKSQFADNDRLSKRLSLLNLERQNGAKLSPPISQPLPNSPPSKPLRPADRANQEDGVEDIMQLDDTKHKVYIYNMDDELSDSASEVSDDEKVFFLPDVQKRLKENRLQAVLGTPGVPRNDNQLVLYRIPTSLTVSEEQDSVRKAIIETRQRARAKQQEVKDIGQAPVEKSEKNRLRIDAHQQVSSSEPAVREVHMAADYDDVDAMDLG